MKNRRESLPRSILFTLFLFGSVPFYGVTALLMGVVSTRWTYQVAVAWSRAVLYVLDKLCGLDYSVEGLEHTQRDVCVVLLKHSSAWETIAQLAIFPKQTWVLKRELLWAPVLGWVLLLMRPIAINRKARRVAVEQVVSLGSRRLDEGCWVMIFPEGTRVAAGKVGRYGISGALLAIESGRPVIPVAHNAGAYWPRRGWRKRPGTIRMKIGAPIPSDGRSARELTDAVKQWIETEVSSMSDV
ncbi:MAG: lysophospholipid acyltransferase family protein [Gammaproteobacteria bacterium]